MLSWAENLGVAFPVERRSLEEWLPILESGLAGLTVGAIPPALDQVLVGAIDRSRNPNLELVLVPGLNEGLFPAAPASLGLLTETDRRHLDTAGMRVGVDQRLHLAHERYYGYIACTRASSRLVLTFSERDVEGRPRSPSPLISHLQRLFPGLVPVAFDGRVAPGKAVHRHELAPLWLAGGDPAEVDRGQLESILRLWEGSAPSGSGRSGLWNRASPTPKANSSLASAGRGPDWLRRLRGYVAGDTLDPVAARVLHGCVLATSVSALEMFAACPFRFFVGAGLRAQECRRYEVDAREQGSYQHEILARFHRDLSAKGLRWRDLDPDAAVQRVRKAADRVAQEYRSGLFRSNPVAACQARAMTAAVGDFVATTVRWMRACAFDPVAVELEFGTRSAELPPWTLDLGEGRRLEFRGKIDRIDLLAGVGDRAGWVLVLDYKSSRLKLDSLLLEHGIQLQLPAYLAAVRRLPGLAEHFGQSRLLPAGAFYVGLRGSVPQAAHRREALADTAEQNAQAYQHRGRYRLEVLPSLDSGVPDHPSGQFHYAFNRNGEPSKRATDLLTGPQLEDLLDAIETRLIETGRRILGGDIRVDPYRHGQETACARCDFWSICRIDPWTHSFRVLQAGASGGTSDAHA
jgi:ATP-dependent helicase/nuclease subunit B